jgi:hypothetical protein
MKLLARYVLFFCDDCEKLAPAIKALESINKFHTVITSENESDFLEKIKLYSPELLLVYLHSPPREYVSLIRTIRENTDFSSIPLLVYKTLPKENDLIDAFQRMIKFES